MTSIIYRLCGSLWNDPSSSNYKKYDDQGLQEAEQWVQKYPIATDFKKWKDIEVDLYVQNLVRDLKSFPITSANKELVKNHLVEVCKFSFPKVYILQNIDSLKGSKREIQEIKDQL